MPQNGLFSESSSTFKEIIFSNSKFLASISVSDTKYKQPRFSNNNLFNFFNYQLDYTLAHYFAESETTKRNVDKFLINLLIKRIIKKLSYYNIDE